MKTAFNAQHDNGSNGSEQELSGTGCDAGSREASKYKVVNRQRSR